MALRARSWEEGQGHGQRAPSRTSLPAQRSECVSVCVLVCVLRRCGAREINYELGACRKSAISMVSHRREFPSPPGSHVPTLGLAGCGWGGVSCRVWRENQVLPVLTPRNLLHPATELPATSALGGVAASVSERCKGSLFHLSCSPRGTLQLHACWTLLALVSPAAPSLAALPVRPCGPSQTMRRCWGRSQRCCSGSATTTLITRQRARRSSTRPHRLCCCRRSTASSCASTATPSSTRFAARGV